MEITQIFRQHRMIQEVRRMNMMFPLLWVLLGALTGAALESLTRDKDWFSFLLYVVFGATAAWFGGYWSSGMIPPGYTLAVALAFAALASLALMALRRALK